MDDIAKQIAKESKSSFYYAFSLLPEQKRDALNTVYAFCRQTDDIIDEGNESEEFKYEKLRKWRIELEKSQKGESEYYLLNKLSKIISQFNIPLEPFFELIKGMEMDLQMKRYPNIDDLMLYCYRVASTVGLMCIEIFGYRNKSAKDFAINLGYALQLTNIIRDVNIDAQKNRIYLPQDDLKKFSYTDKDIYGKVYNDNFVNLMRHEALRAREYFEQANKHLDFEDKPAMFAARAMQHIYFRLLEKIEEKN
ncbi:MAG TPA: squalene/phytoene synthase family protein [Ignavibacteriales bacterium]|nr:squalene/phytoene synthase family protein [Ignavibacteriales bacterium]